MPSKEAGAAALPAIDPVDAGFVKREGRVVDASPAFVRVCGVYACV